MPDVKLLAKPEHEIVYQDLVAFIRSRTETLKAREVLAVAANMLGKLIAMQDQRTTSPEIAMKIVVANMELGNQQAINELGNSQGRA